MTEQELAERQIHLFPGLTSDLGQVSRPVTKPVTKPGVNGRPRTYHPHRPATDAERQQARRQWQKRFIHFRSEKHTWATPPETFDPLYAEFGFTLDVCALPSNTKCPRFYSPEHDGLVQDWGTETCWCNPPYNKVAQWVQKAYEASKAGALVVCLIPSRTGTRWFQGYVLPYAEIRYLDKRIRFVGAKNVAPFDAAVVIFRPPIG